MKKKFKKRLSIAKETVANLGKPEQANVRGGYDSATCPEVPEECATYRGCTVGCPSINHAIVDPITKVSADPDCVTLYNYCLP